MNQNTMTSMRPRRPKYQHPPTPKILHFPLRTRTRTRTSASTPKSKPLANNSSLEKSRRVKLEALFGKEREFVREVVPIVGVDDDFEVKERKEVGGGVCEEENLMEKWRFQAEILRAECKFLRVEKEIVVKKMERRRVLMERTLRSALHALHSEKRRLSDGTSYTPRTMQEKIEELSKKLEKLIRRLDAKNLECRKCCNLDRQASVLRSRLERLGGESKQICVKEIREMAEASFTGQIGLSSDEVNSMSKDNSLNLLTESNSQVDSSRRKTEGVSYETRTLLQRLEEDQPLMPSASISSAANTSNCSKQIMFRGKSLSSTRQACKEVRPCEEKTCSGCCRAIMRKVVEQVQAETEQWSQMQEMLEQVRNEMEHLQASRDTWEERALKSNLRIQSLTFAVQDWKQRAISSEAKLNELQAEVSTLRAEMQNLEIEKTLETTKTMKNVPLVSKATRSEKEKRVLSCRLKENRHVNTEKCRNNEATIDHHSYKTRHDDNKWLPLQEIGNSSPLLVRQKSGAIFPLQGPLSSSQKPRILHVLRNPEA